MINAKDSEAQRLAWELKEDAWREVAHLPAEEAFKERRLRSARMIETLGLQDRVRDPRKGAKDGSASHP